MTDDMTTDADLQTEPAEAAAATTDTAVDFVEYQARNLRGFAHDDLDRETNPR